MFPIIRLRGFIIIIIITPSFSPFIVVVVVVGFVKLWCDCLCANRIFILSSGVTFAAAVL